MFTRDLEKEMTNDTTKARAIQASSHRDVC